MITECDNFPASCDTCKGRFTCFTDNDDENYTIITNHKPDNKWQDISAEVEACAEHNHGHVLVYLTCGKERIGLWDADRFYSMTPRTMHNKYRLVRDFEAIGGTKWFKVYKRKDKLDA